MSWQIGYFYFLQDAYGRFRSASFSVKVENKCLFLCFVKAVRRWQPTQRKEEVAELLRGHSGRLVCGRSQQLRYDADWGPTDGRQHRRRFNAALCTAKVTSSSSSFSRQNRLQESLDLFASVCTNGVFRTTSMVSRLSAVCLLHLEPIKALADLRNDGSDWEPSALTARDYVPDSTNPEGSSSKMHHLKKEISHSRPVKRFKVYFMLVMYFKLYSVGELSDLVICFRCFLIQILLLNKTDLFQEKIRHSGRHLRLYFPKYEGVCVFISDLCFSRKEWFFFFLICVCVCVCHRTLSLPPTGADGDVDAAAHFITAMFSSRSHRPVFHHYTTATDTANASVVFHMVVEQISQEQLASVQLL